MISVLFDRKARTYTGRELRPHFLLSELGLRGSALGAFLGPCKVQTEHLVDWEDRLANDRIEAGMMVHFIGEFFGSTLKEGVLKQRLFMASIAESINENLFSKKFGQDKRVKRSGNDLFALDRKLSVSIVTASPVSGLLHVGINIDPSGAPVPAIGLLELGFSRLELEEAWIPSILKAFANENESIDWACAKVRPVI